VCYPEVRLSITFILKRETTGSNNAAARGGAVMALVKCEDCGQEIGEKSKQCIYCGSPNSYKQKKNVHIDGPLVIAIKAIFIFLIICFIYLLYTNWKIIEDCYGWHGQYNALTAAFMTFLSWMLQIFGLGFSPSQEISCKELGSPNLVLLSRLVFFGLVGGGVLIRIAKKMGFKY
jgi:hypothetical protein